MIGNKVSMNKLMTFYKMLPQIMMTTARHTVSEANMSYCCKLIAVTFIAKHGIRSLTKGTALQSKKRKALQSHVSH